MGAVYEAQDQDSGRRVALKVLSHTLDSPDARERFFREGRLAASINHPNSVYIFGTDEIGGTPVIAMELVSGGTLQDRVRAAGPMPIGEAVDSVRQIIGGLEAAQRLGILHRDVKPSNCYVGEDGTVKIGDFGLSISTTVRTEPALTATGAFLGTPAFCSPEQLRGDELNVRSDMYSIGVTLYYLLTGRTPFEAKNMVQLLATVLEQPPPSPRDFRPEIPQELAKVILRCLEKQPGERFKSYADMALALAPFGLTAPTPATLSLRFLAGVVDVTLLWGVSLVVNLSVFGGPMAMLDQMMQRSPKVLACLVGWLCATGCYYGVLEGLWGAAAGKALCRLRVVGPDRNPPGFKRASLRALIFLGAPLVPIWVPLAIDPRAYYFSASPWTQILWSSSMYVVMGLLFVTARRRNGFAAVQDLLTRTRVVARTALSPRPMLAANEPQPSAESAITIGPYQVMEALSESAGERWFLGYDLKLLRKVWLRTSPPGTSPVPVQLRNLGRAGRLRWLTGKRSAEENWDAFEALSGRALLDLIGTPQPWCEVRFWLHDLATEISAAEQDGTLPALALDRVWITGDGRAKLLDFPAPRAGSSTEAPIEGAGVFMKAAATSALGGNRGGLDQVTNEVALPLPLHAREFLMNLSRTGRAEAVAAALKPLLSRAAVVSRWRRAALVAGCVAFPVMACGFGVFGLSFVRELIRQNPGLMDLNRVLQLRSSARFWGGKHVQWPSDGQIEIYIASHYADLITNASSWNPMLAGMIKGEARRFAEKSVAEHPTLTEAEIAEANEAVGKYLPKEQIFGEKTAPALPAFLLTISLLIYVGLPAVLAALAFRGGVVLLIAGVTFTRRDGARASRLRLFWRALLVWGPVLPVCAVSMFALNQHWGWESWMAVGLLGLLAVASVALPVRGLQDRLAGTWPVPR
jgi:hypothetical protein